MRYRAMLAALAMLAACGKEEESATPPPPATLTQAAIGHFCGMVVLDHPGPKAQIFVAGRPEPYWFTSVRDAVAFTLLPEEPKDVTAFYVTDMGKADDWDRPQSWIAAGKAVFVIGSARRGGMGQQEAIPFADAAAADQFAAQQGGRIVALADIPEDYILGGDESPAAEGAGR